MSKQKIFRFLSVYGIVGCVAILVLSSCRSHKELAYNPTEVQQLARELGFTINNADPDIPLYAEASVWLGVPYRYAGLNRKGIDCSGLVNRIYNGVYSQTVSRSTDDLARTSKNVSKNNLRAGDLVFFATTGNKKKITHVGIYLKDGFFVHASTSKGVIICHLNEDYYKKRWKKGGRMR